MNTWEWYFEALTVKQKKREINGIRGNNNELKLKRESRESLHRGNVDKRGEKRANGRRGKKPTTCPVRVGKTTKKQQQQQNKTKMVCRFFSFFMKL